MRNKVIIITLLVISWPLCSYSQQKITAERIVPKQILQEVIKSYCVEFQALNCLANPCSLILYVNEIGNDSTVVSIQQLRFFSVINTKFPIYYFNSSGCFVLVKILRERNLDSFQFNDSSKSEFKEIEIGYQEGVIADGEATLWDVLITSQRFLLLNKHECK